MKRHTEWLLKLLFNILVPFSILSCQPAEKWKPLAEKLMTTWGENIDATNMFPEYPRPLLERENWLNLNGLWRYSILPSGSGQPDKYMGEILVPFPVESALSGVKKTVGEANELWYSRKFSIPESWKGRRIKINFGAVDWKAIIWVNGKLAGEHTGGYTPFSFDITGLIKEGRDQNIVVKNGIQPKRELNRPASSGLNTLRSGTGRLREYGRQYGLNLLQISILLQSGLHLI